MVGCRRDVGLLAGLVGFALVLSACTTNPPPVEAPPPAAPDMPASIRSEEVVGRWGYGSYHNEGDRPRTEAAARGQCGQPVVINRGPNGGVLMYLADSAQLQELYLKGGPGSRNYIGPLDESGSANPLRHRRLCALRGGRRGATAAALVSCSPSIGSGVASEQRIDVALRNMPGVAAKPRAV
jgi:CubicO group peptidase (beta-lactamase class C family)